MFNTLLMYYFTRTWQLENLRECDAVIQRSRDHTVCPQTFGLQFIHLLTGVHVIFTSDYPFISGSGDDKPDPTKKTHHKTREL